MESRDAALVTYRYLDAYAIARSIDRYCGKIRSCLDRIYIFLTISQKNVAAKITAAQP